MKNRMEKNYDNLSEAVAFQIAFEFMVYQYSDMNWYDVYEETCTMCRGYRQYADFMAPKSNCKKDYAVLDTCYYGVSKEVMRALIENFNVTEDDFRPIRNKTGDIVYYQITPRHTLLPIKSVNRIKELKPCRKCGSVQHRMKTYKNKQGAEYYYITKEALEDMHDINETYERFNIFIPEFIVSRRVYDYLIEIYPRMRFIPLFLAE